MKDFKPMLSIDIKDATIKYPKLVSYKLDGIRFIVHPLLGMVTRALKPIPNIRIREKFQPLLDIAIRDNIIFDGEIYSHKLTFQQMISVVMTHDTTVNVDKVKFHCFECVAEDTKNAPFIKRNADIKVLLSKETDLVMIVNQRIVNSKEEVDKLYRRALSDGYEGLILRSEKSPYKFGRSTLREEYMLKVKPFKTFDSYIICVEQSTKVDPLVDKTINELGRSVTSKKKDDRILIEKASAFWVNYGFYKVKVSLAMTDEEKIEVWKNRKSYIGRMIEYRGMLVGSKDVPRHPTFIRFRDDRPVKKIQKNESLNKWM